MSTCQVDKPPNKMFAPVSNRLQTGEAGGQGSMAPVLKIEKAPTFSFSPEGWVYIESNKENLIDAGLWNFLHETLPEMDPQLVSEFIKNSYYGASEEVTVRGKNVRFTPEVVAEKLGLQGTGLTLGGVNKLTNKKVR